MLNSLLHTYHSLNLTIVDLLFFLAEVFIVIEYLFVDILYLRIVAIFNSALYVAGALSAINQSGMKMIAIASLVCVIINVVQCYFILKDRSLIFLPFDLRKIYSESFGNMKVYEFLKIFRLGHMIEIAKDTMLTVQFENVPELFFITQGNVAVYKNSHPVIELQQGNFIGEISFLKGGKASATVKVTSDDCKAIVWNKQRLKQLEKKHLPLYSKFEQSLAINLIKKLSLQGNNGQESNNNYYFQ